MGTDVTGLGDEAVSPQAEARSGDYAVFDWRRPSKFNREHVRAFATAHEVFARRMASGLGGALRALVQLELVSVDQVSYDDYLRSLPNPNVTAIVSMPPLPGAALLELNVQFALQLVDRMLGGRGLPVDLRRPTDLETPLVRDLLSHGVTAVTDTIGPLLDGPAELTALEFNPQLVQVTAPSDMALLLSYRLTVSQGEPSQGLLTLCYPSVTLSAVLEGVASSSAATEQTGGELPAGVNRLASYLGDLDVTLSVRLQDSLVAAGDLARLQVGDVLRLDHRVEQPVHACVGASRVLEGHIGRRGRRLGLQVGRWLTTEDEFFSAPNERN